MEFDFDADWVWFLIFAGVIVVRFIGSQIARARRGSKTEIPTRPRPQKTRRVSEPSGPPASAETYKLPDTPEPIEPR